MRLVVVLCLLMPSVCPAQTGGDIDLNAFRGAVDSRGYVTANASQPLGRGELSFGLVTSWGFRVLELATADAVYSVDNVITPSLQAAYGLGPVELGVTAPFVVLHGDGVDAQGLGDVGLHAKARLLDTSRHGLGVALLASLFVPGGYERGKWLGEGSVTLQPWLIVDKELARLRVALNVGLRLRTGDAHGYVNDSIPATMTRPAVPGTGMEVRAGHDIPFALGVSYALAPQRFDLVVELFGGVPLRATRYQPLEAIAGVKLYLARNSFFLLGGGVGLVPGGAGANPDARAFLGILFEPSVGDRDGDGLKDDVDRCPDDPEDKDEFEDLDGCPEPDNDRDQILDVDDRCPNEPEDKDGVDDGDGCPDTGELDRDGDGLSDDIDGCPDDPEDFDGWQDRDGCPELDNDGDALLDVDDLCPNDAEDADRWKDSDGCPEPDNDGDRVLDGDDDCPNEKETYNNKDDDDGCPDRGIAVDVQTGIDIVGTIYFETNKAVIKGAGSFEILDAVAAMLLGNDDITRVEIQGHTDSRNTAAYNRQLSQARAEAVRDYLISKQVAAARLVAKGYGEDDPIDPCDERLQCRRRCASACASNRRVAFVVLERR